MARLQGITAYLPESVRRQWLSERDQADAWQSRWARVAGGSLASHVQPVCYRDGRLLLHADSSIWANKVRYRRQALLSQLQAQADLPPLHTLEVRVAPPGPAAAPPAPRPARSGALPPDAAALIRAVAEDIPDPGLRAALQRLSGRTR